MAASYGQGVSVSVLAEAMASVSYADLVLEHLIVQSDGSPCSEATDLANTGTDPAGIGCWGSADVSNA